MISSWTEADTALCDHLYKVELSAHTRPWSKGVFNSCFAPRYFRRYLQENNEIVGFYIAEIVVDEVTLMNICVDPRFQGKGYGKTLLSSLIDESKQRQATQINLEVRSRNLAAICLYQQHGFLVMGKRDNYYKVENGTEDAILMTLTLDK